MSKLLSTLIAGAVFALGGIAFAADEPARDSGQAPQSQPQGAPVEQGNEDVGTTGREAARDADKTQNQARDTVDQTDTNVSAEGRNPDQPAGSVPAKQEEYLADLKKCDSLSGAQKKDCIAAAKKKAGQL